MDITSLDNKLVKHITSLHQKKYRDSENEFIIEGMNSITEAIKSNFEIKSILFMQSQRCLKPLSEVNI